VSPQSTSPATPTKERQAMRPASLHWDKPAARLFLAPKSCC
jgi:hypothetical protein